MRHLMTVVACVLAAGLSTGCEPSGSPNKPSSTPAPSTGAGSGSTSGSGTQAGTTAGNSGQPAGQAPAAGTGAASGTVEAGGVTFAVPTGWQQVPPSNPMRLAELVVPDASGDAKKACTVAVSTAGGDVASNVARWQNQMKDASGQPAKADLSTKDMGGWKLHTVELSGSYQGMSDPAPQPDWMMRGAIVEMGAESVFIKMTGPAANMKAASAGWTSLVESIRKP